MSDIILISKVGLYETVKCAICENPIKSERGCNGSCQYDKELHKKIVEAVEGIAEQRPHGDCRDRLKEVFREYSSISGDMFHLSQIENIIDGEPWL